MSELTHLCAHCGGVMIRSAFKGDPPSCLLCGRTAEPPITPQEAIERKKHSVRADHGRHLG